jgi:dTMP kinase
VAGALLVFEGIDQAGKMTQARALATRLRAARLGCEVVHYPDYDTAIGRVIRASLTEGMALDTRARCMLFAANRWEKDALLRATLARNALLCVDRYTASNVVYGLSQGLDESWLRGLETGLLAADLTLLVDIPPEESRRRKTRDRDDYERDAQLLEDARGHYLRFAAREGWAVVDGTGESAQVTERICAAVAQRLGAHHPELAAGLLSPGRVATAALPAAHCAARRKSSGRAPFRRRSR